MGMLDPVKCLIGQLQQIIQVCRILGVPRHADTCGDDKCMLLFSLIFRDHPRIDRLIHASGDKAAHIFNGLSVGCIPEDHQEFIPAHTYCRASVLSQMCQPVSDLLQNHISHVMTVIVIDRLKVIQIQRVKGDGIILRILDEL